MTVSVVVPTHDQAPYIRPCLDSIWFQDFTGELEIVLVNDGSTDNTAEVVEAFIKDVDSDMTSYASCYNEDDDIIERICHKRYTAQGRSIEVLTNPTNKGLPHALNIGFEACHGKYCTYIPSDNYCYPSMFADLVAALEEGYDFVFSDMLIVDDPGNVIRRFSLPTYSFERSFCDWYFCGVSKLYRRELHDRFGYYEQDLLAHDHELFLRFAEGGARFWHIPKALMAVRHHDKAREVGIHAPANWNRLLEESKNLTLRARRFADQIGK